MVRNRDSSRFRDTRWDDRRKALPKDVAWQGNFEKWGEDPLHVRPIAHTIWDPHFGQPAVEAFTRGGASAPVNIAYSGVYQWWYTIGMRTNVDLYNGSLFLLFVAGLFLFAGWLHLQPTFAPAVSWFKNAESRLNHHLSGLFGVSSLAWTGHLVHVAIPASRGETVRWDNFLTTLPHPACLAPFFTGQWAVYAQNPDTAEHIFGTSEGAGTAILTFLGGFHPQTQSLWLTDMAHHHLAIAVLFIIAGHQYRTNFGIGHRCSMFTYCTAHVQYATLCFPCSGFHNYGSTLLTPPVHRWFYYVWSVCTRSNFLHS